jgi:hypothetical protein
VSTVAELAKVGDVIRSGGAIPDNVVEVTDHGDDIWTLTPRGHWHLGEAGKRRCQDGRCVGGGDPTAFAPLTVTAVREPEPAAVEVIATTTVGGAKVPIYAEPQQPDASGLLDLVRQLRQMVISDYAFVVDEAAALFDRIAALLPQQPVQARDIDGDPWFIHGCGVLLSAGKALHRVGCDRDPWRPLLVGGDPAPEQPRDRAVEQLADDYAAMADRLAHAAIERLGVPLTDEGQYEVWEVALAALTAQPAEPGPLRLTLPEVPPGTVALRFFDNDEFPARAERTPDGLWRIGDTVYTLADLFVLALDKQLTVELAPPREPRTWPRIDSAPDSVKSFTGESGLRYVRHLAPNGTPTNLFQPDPAVTLLGERIPAATLSHWAEVDGPLTEVFDDEAGTR